MTPAVWKSTHAPREGIPAEPVAVETANETSACSGWMCLSHRRYNFSFASAGSPHCSQDSDAERSLSMADRDAPTCFLPR